MKEIDNKEHVDPEQWDCIFYDHYKKVGLHHARKIMKQKYLRIEEIYDTE